MPDNKKNLLSENKNSSRNESVNPAFRMKKGEPKTVNEYVDGILSGSRTILSRAITLIESSKKEHQETAEQIIEACLEHTGESVRIGISGVPGVGKSTFIDALGEKLIDEGKKIAVLTIDPSSSRSKGSILGDKTRMKFLSTHKNAYVRPSPASGTLGGVARKSRETMLLCEAAGFDTIIIETVGVGQSETAVHTMADFFLLLMLAGAGDELQGIKRGIMEMADLIAINKADGGNIEATDRARLEYKNALTLFPTHASGWQPTVHTCSAVEKRGLDKICKEIERYFKRVKENGYFERNRKNQALHWMYETIDHQLKDRFYNHPEIKKNIGQKIKDVQEGRISSFKAASELIRSGF